MNTKVLMTTSAITLATAGIILTFIPEEILIYFNWGITKHLQFLTQILGALYFAFGMLNWMTRASLIGGIYNKPIVAANSAHFMIAGLTLIKALISNPELPYPVWIIATIYTGFAISFIIIFFRHPTPQNL